MNCKKARLRLSAYQDGELAPAPSREVELHLQHCAACRSELEALDGLLGNLRRLAMPVAAPGFSSRVMAGLQARPRARLRLLPQLAYSLALLAIFVSGFLLEMSANGPKAAPAQPATTFSAVLAESLDLGLLTVHDSTLELFSRGDHEN